MSGPGGEGAASHLQPRSLGHDLAAGLFAGGANVIASHPLDTLKVVLQASPSGQAHSGAFSAARALVHASGLRGLYRGLPAPLLGGALETAVNYATYGAVRGELSPQTGPVAASLVAGSLAGVALSAVLSPLELLKCRVQAGADSGVVAAARRVLVTQGVAGFGRGLGPTLAREVPGNALFFACYEALQRAAADTPLAASALTAPLCGGFAGVAYWLAVLPVDTAKTRIQVLSPGMPCAELGLLATMRAEYAARGLVRGWYAGARPVVARAFVANAAQWAAWDWATSSSPGR